MISPNNLFKNSNLFSRKSITAIILATAVLLSAIFKGSQHWLYCIIPYILLLSAIFLNIKKLSFSCSDAIPFFLIIIGFISMAITQADKQESLYDFEVFICLIIAIYVGKVIEKQHLLQTVAILGTAIAIAGLLSYCNLLDVDGFLFNDRSFIRLQSFVEYANIAAILLGCAYFCIHSIALEKESLILSLASATTLIAMYLTLSKAAIPIFLVTGTLLCLKDNRYIKRYFAQNTVCIAAMFPILLAAKAHQNALCILLITLCIIICTNARFEISKKKLVICCITLAAAAAVAVCAIVLATKFRIFDTLYDRMVYVRDAAKLIKKNWLFGVGPAGFRHHQFVIQSMQYNIVNMHNGWMQYFIEYGIVFFLLFTALMARALYKLYKQKEHVLFIILLFISLHAIVDFDFSFAVILIIVGIIIGHTTTDDKKHSVLKICTAAILTVSIAVSGYMCCEYVARSRFEKAYMANDPSALEKAYVLEKICPFDSNLQITLATLENDNYEERLQKAMSLSPLNYEFYKKYIYLSIDNGKGDLSQMCKTYVSYAPKQESIYTNAKDILNYALSFGACTEAEYADILRDLEEIRIKEGVADREALLEELAKNNLYTEKMYK